MNAREIEDALTGVLGERIIFLGCHPENHLYTLLKQASQRLKPCVFILNTLGYEDNTDQIGHWFTVYIDYSSNTLGYYDSYMLPPLLNSSTLYHYIKTHPNLTVSTLTYRFQGLHSLVCGVYSMYVCYLLSFLNITQTLSCLHSTFEKHKFLFNDKLISRLGYKIFNLPKCSKTFCKNDIRCQRNICDHT